jgi:hypothetical protein
LFAPIILLVKFIKDLGIDWGRVWNGIKAAVETAVFIISFWLAELGFILSHVIDRVWPDDWARFWDNITGIVRRAVDAVKGFIGDIRKEIDNFLNLIKQVGNPFSNPFGRSAGPTAMMVGPASRAAGPATQAVAPMVINVSVVTKGLGVDNPETQRAVVEAIRRYVNRNGPVMVN